MTLRASPLLLLFAANVGANESVKQPSIYDLTLKELLSVKVITAASGYEQKLQRAASNATVITPEEWQAMGAVTLSDLINTVSGAHVTRSTISYLHNIFAFRGLGGSFNEQIKLLLDGQPMEFAQSSGRFPGFNLPLSLFKRVEIIKGPGSAVYGADAFAGVINLVSYGGEKQPKSVQLLQGSVNTSGLSIHQNFAFNDHKVNFALDYLRSDDDQGRIVERDFQSQLDELLSTNASLAPGPMDEHYEVLSLLAQWQWHQFSLDYQTYRNFDMGLGVGIGQSLDTAGHDSYFFDRWTIKWSPKDLVKNGFFDVNYSYNIGKNNSQLHIFPSGTVLPIGSDGNINFVDAVGFTHFTDGLIGTPSARRITQDLHMTHIFNWDEHKTRWQVGYNHLNFRALEQKNFGPGILDGTQDIVDGTLIDVTHTPWVYLPHTTRSYYYLSLLDEWDINQQWILNLGGRLDRYSDFGSTVNPRMSLHYQYSTDFLVKLFFGSAFRAPSVSELYGQNNPVGVGNPDLGPEGVNNLEVGANIDYLVNDNLFIKLNIFNYKARDLINYRFVPDLNTNVAQNLGEQQGNGGELSLRWKPIKDITFNAHYSWSNAQNEVGDKVEDYPNDMVYVDFNWRIKPNLQWLINSKWVNNRARVSTDSRPAIANYNMVNSHIAYSDLIPGMTLSITAKNLFDSDIRHPSSGSIVNDFPMPGRQWIFKVQYRY